MFDASSNTIVGLEIGTSKVCAVIADASGGGALNIIGIGQAKSRGVRKGEVSDPDLAGEDVRAAIVEAEQMANVEVRHVYLGVTGNHIRGFNNRGVHPVVSAGREIAVEDVQSVLTNAKAISLPPDCSVIHAIRQLFYVDGAPGVHNPVGTVGSRVEADVHIIQGNVNRLKNSIRVVKGLQLEVNEVVFNGLASALALLGSEEKDQGALVIDLGAGTTEYCIYADGVIKHTGVLAVGGDHVTNDLACGLKLPMGRAEQLKVEHGSALVEESAKGRQVELPGEPGLPVKTVNLEHLRRIMQLRLAETFLLIEQEIAELELLDSLRAGVFLCGGGARTPGVARLAENTFQLPARIGKASSLTGQKSALDQPEFSAGLGLVKIGALRQKRRDAGSITENIKKTLTDIFKR